jgi:hypothetical protein
MMDLLGNHLPLLRIARIVLHMVLEVMPNAFFLGLFDLLSHLFAALALTTPRDSTLPFAFLLHFNNDDLIILSIPSIIIVNAHQQDPLAGRLNGLPFYHSSTPYVARTTALLNHPRRIRG